MKKIALAGISWYDRDDYPRIREIMIDANTLPLTYEAWKVRAEKLERDAKARGLRTTRVIIKPEEFVAWCAGQRITIDAKARQLFAAAAAMRRTDN